MVTARIQFEDRTIECDALNPGEWFGNTYIFGIERGYWLHYVAVEADTLSDALDELVSSEKYEHEFLIDEIDLPDFVDNVHYNDNGNPVCLDNLHLPPEEQYTQYTIVYMDEGILPSSGISPNDYYYFSDHLDSLNDKLSELSADNDIVPALRAMCADSQCAHIDEKEQMCHLILDYLSDNPIIYTFEYDGNDQEIFEICERIEDLFPALKPICEGLKR